MILTRLTSPKHCKARKKNTLVWPWECEMGSLISVDLLELFVHAFIQHTHLQRTHFEAAATRVIVRTNIRPNIKVKFKGSLPVWQEKA